MILKKLMRLMILMLFAVTSCTNLILSHAHVICHIHMSYNNNNNKQIYKAPCMPTEGCRGAIHIYHIHVVKNY